MTERGGCEQSEHPIRRKENGWYDEEHPLVFLFLGSSGIGNGLCRFCFITGFVCGVVRPSLRCCFSPRLSGPVIDSLRQILSSWKSPLTGQALTFHCSNRNRETVISIATFNKPASHPTCSLLPGQGEQ
ncbi:hypothetical protein JZ751_005440 [Albula glossodonta]|uniref:Uncharacterized protein n=1 Tax=Albula glossodonta TaxID=121402 RepID=A0A8T2N792_9TELE|nr:hypothetical protein JZ751_005440 [Albula glossodonta]